MYKVMGNGYHQKKGRLGGDFKHFFVFSPQTMGRRSNLRSIFFNWPPTRLKACRFFFYGPFGNPGAGMTNKPYILVRRIFAKFKLYYFQLSSRVNSFKQVRDD